MYNQSYEVACSITSFIIMICSIYILSITKNFLMIFIALSGLLSLLTRLYRIKNKKYIMNHPLVYLDIFFAIIAFLVFIYRPLNDYIYYPIILAFIFMIIAAIMSWNIFPFYLVEESFYFQLTGHIIICLILLYSISIL